MKQELNPFSELQEQFSWLVVQPLPWIIELRSCVLAIANAIAPVVQRGLQVHGSALAALLRMGVECHRIERAGWLPHYTTPFDALANTDVTIASTTNILERHYTDNWTSVKQAFLDRLQRYELDDEAKSVFVEALMSHEHGLYRACPRLLFPEIERVARVELHEGSTGPITSQRVLIEMAGDLGLGEVEPGGIYSMQLFTKLFDHLYAHVKTDEEKAAIALDPVPNRHATLHGLRSYSTQQNSINALIMTDFIFQIICAVKRNAVPQESQAAA